MAETLYHIMNASYAIRKRYDDDVDNEVKISHRPADTTKSLY